MAFLAACGEFVSFVNDAQGNPIYENTMQYAILKKEWKTFSLDTI